MDLDKGLGIIDKPKMFTLKLSYPIKLSDFALMDQF